MQSTWGRERYWTSFVEDSKAGSAGLRLHREADGQEGIAAEVMFWEAMGQFFLQTFDCDVPVTIVELLIAEAKERIKIQ